MTDDAEDLSGLLEASRRGDPGARDRVFAATYARLRTLARSARGGAKGNATLDTTGLVHEAYLKLTHGHDGKFQDRAHFFALACRAMRQIIIDAARRRRPALPLDAPRTGEGAPVLLEQRGTPPLELVLSVDAALARLEQVEPRLAQVVTYRFFGGLEELEIAGLLQVTVRTVRRDWRKAKAWLLRALDDGAAAGSDGVPAGAATPMPGDETSETR